MATGLMLDSNGASPSGSNGDGRLTRSVVIICIVAASAGLIFGYDIGVSGGLTATEPFLQKFFPTVLEKMADAKQNQYCTFDSQVLTAFTSSLYIAGLASSLVAGRLTASVGRRGTLIAGGAVFLIGTAFNAFAMNVGMLLLGRILLGFAIGFTNQAAPVYLSEMAPPKWRGALSTSFQFFLSAGVVLATFVNFGVAQLGSNGWRIALGFGIVPASIMTIGALLIPDTPSSLIQRGYLTEARKSLALVRGTDCDIESEINDLINHNEAARSANQQPYKTILKREFRPHLILTVLIPSFQQLTGIHIIAFYAPVLFRSVGWGAEGALIGAIILGAVNLGSTLVSTFAVDRLGRRFLFIEAGAQILVCQIALALLLERELGTEGTAPLSKGAALVVLILMCLISAAFGWSWGPLTWLVPSEILPMEVRPVGLGICIAVNFLVTFILSQTFLAVLCRLKYAVFLFYAAWVLAMTVFVAAFVPETKGIPLESMGAVWQHHWFWNSFAKPPQITGSNHRIY